MAYGFVLVGGRSSRMGRDKTRLPYRGVPMALHQAEKLAVVCGRVALVGKDPEAFLDSPLSLRDRRVARGGRRVRRRGGARVLAGGDESRPRGGRAALPGVLSRGSARRRRRDSRARRGAGLGRAAAAAVRRVAAVRARPAPLAPRGRGLLPRRRASCPSRRAHPRGGHGRDGRRRSGEFLQRQHPGGI